MDRLPGWIVGVILGLVLAWAVGFVVVLVLRSARPKIASREPAESTVEP